MTHRTDKIFSLTRIKPILTIEHLTYGIGKESNRIFIFLKKRGKQWAKKHGPFDNEVGAIRYINLIKDEYNAVREKQNSSKASS